MTKVTPAQYIKNTFNPKENKWFWWDILFNIGFIVTLWTAVTLLMQDKIWLGIAFGIVCFGLLIAASTRFATVFMGLIYSLQGKTLVEVRNSNFEHMRQKLGNSEDQINMKLEQKKKNAIDWFYWIAGISLLNTLLLMTKSSIYLLFGLGISNLIVATGMAFSQTSNSWVPQLISFILASLFSGFFILVGRKGMESRRWVIVGLIIYALDLIPLILLDDVLSVGFHLFALLAIITQYYSAISLIKAGIIKHDKS